jgi:beta-galactosidase GanA
MSADTPAPHLEKRGQVTQLIVDGKPYLALAGELHNSSASSLAYMQPIWSRLKAMNLNTVLATVTWEQVEPTEGNFDFSIVDGLVREARRNDLRLVLLWFGSWKNSTSRYAADYVKADPQRFPRVINKAGQELEILSTQSRNTLGADTRAYTAFMQHLKQIDGDQHTVVMIQMQNEVGILGDSRDHSPAANEAFNGQVPAELMAYLQQHKGTLRPELRKLWDGAGNKTSGTWTEVFGNGVGADEAFQAWSYARFCDHITAAGKKEYNIPVFVNAWIVQPQDKAPGDYPSGGPQAHVHDLWLAGAPSIDILAPDIYLPDFPGVMAMYAEKGRAMFVPESRASAANAYYAIGQANSIGYSPFGIDNERNEVTGPFPQAYAVLGQLAPQILEAQSNGKIGAVWLGRQNPSAKLALGDYTLNIELRTTRGSNAVPDAGYALAILSGPDEYTISGADVQVTFTPNTAGPPIVGLMKVEEMKVVTGKKSLTGTQPSQLQTMRRLNGDEVQLRYELSEAAEEKQSGAGLRFVPGAPGVQRVSLYRYGK